MKKSKIARWITAGFTAFTFLFALIIPMGGGTLFGLLDRGGSVASSDKVTASASGITRPSGSTFGQLVDGSSYIYTDKTLMQATHAGNSTEDFTSKAVNTSLTHGTADNPYVIENRIDWENFVQWTAKDATFGAGRVFVLASDIDFAETTSSDGTALPPFHMVGVFQGAFYGTGHSLKNITNTDWVYYNKATSSYAAVTNAANYTNGGFGVFGKIQDAEVTDLIVENFSFTNVQQVTSISVWDGSAIGGVAGVTYGNSYVLNCQTSGHIAHVSFVAGRGSQFGWPSGIVGSHRNTNTTNRNLYIYRCSAEVSIDAPTASNFHQTGAGIIGEVWETAYCYVYDCAANVSVNTPARSIYSHIGACTGWSNGYIYIENFVGSTTNTPDVTEPRSGALGGATFGTLKKNVWVDGKQGTLNLPPWAGAGTLTNVNVVKAGAYHNTPGGIDVPAGNQFGTRSALQTAAKNAIGGVLPSAIWNAENITKTTFTPENSPVRNPLKISVSYYDYINGQDRPYSWTEDGPQEVKGGESLETPEAKTGRKFMGWTTDKTGASAPFTSVPVGMFGDNNLYAVWEAVTSSAEISAKLGSTALSYDETNGYTGEYDGTGIVLTATLTVDGMTDPDVSYQWERNGENIASGGTAKSYTVGYVNDNGNYSVVLKYKSKSEPLFYGNAYGDEKKVAMTPVDPSKLTFRNVRIPSGSHAYVGADLSDVTPTGNLLFGATQIEADIIWDNSNDRFGSGSSDSVLNGNEETRTVLFRPAEKYGGNYGNNIPYAFTYEIEHLKFTFHLTGFGTMNMIQVDLKYGDNYAYGKIADLFEKEMEPYMSRLGGKAPVFKLMDGSEYKIAEFRNLNKTFTNVSDPAVLQITVRFEAQSHTLTFDPNGGTFEEGVENEPQEVRYGNHAAAPASPPVNDPLLFLGWFYWTKDDDGKDIEVQWDFEKDCVTRDMELHAVWLAADTLDSLTAEIAPGTVFNANEAMDKSKLTVTATFSGNRNGIEVEQTVVLSSAQYTLEYYNSDGTKFTDNKLHVTDDGSNTRVVIKYVNDGSVNDNGVTAELSIKPKKITLNTNELIEKGYFSDSTVEIDPDGNPLSLAIAPGRVADLFGLYLDENKVTYTYSIGGREIDPSQVVKPGEYTVTAHFVPEFADYEAPDISVTLKIVAQKETLNVTWDATEFTFNNKVQVPTPSFTITLADGSEQTIEKVNYRLEGDVDAKSVGNNYYVNLILVDTGYKLDGIVGTAFIIKKAKVAVPAQLEGLDYIGTEYDLNNLAEEYKIYFEGLDTDLVTVTTGATGTNAGMYTAYIVLKDSQNSEWDGVTGVRQQMTWEIKKAQLSVFWGNEHRFNVNADVPNVVYFVGLVEGDMDQAQLSDLTYTGDSDMSKEGSHTLTVSLKASAAWTKNYQLDDSKSFTFVVADGEGDVILVYIEWGETKFVFKDNEWQGPSVTFRNQEDGSDITELLKGLNAVIIENETALWAGNYEMKVSLDSASGYYLYGKTSCNYTISKDKDGNGADPNGGTPLPPGGGDNGDGNTLNIPLWQVIVSGVSTVLFVVCAVKTYSNLSKAKAARRETKELASQSYSVNYGFAPLPLMAVGAFLGMGETPWTIIAFVTLGLFLVSLMAVLLTSRKRKAAELALKREQARIAEEKEFAREEEQLRREEQMREEQRRRDEEFKMMFAAMQQSNSGSMHYEDMQNMIASTVSALLPAMQQQMALPPAQSDMSGYAQPGYVSPEAEMLRAQMAQQQELMAQQQAQMAQQQELINQLLQNQQAPVYEEEEPEDDISWLGGNDEIISLEESYGALSDEGKRAYYEIGSYIMNKPRTSQNDGRYAVLFKYRGRTVFKLAIKDDAPVLYYPLNGGRGEVRIADSASLGTAKSMIDRTVMSVDGELN